MHKAMRFKGLIEKPTGEHEVVHVDTHCAAELIGEVWKSLSICGAKGKHSVDKKADRSEQREWSLVEGEALRQASGRKTSGSEDG